MSFIDTHCHIHEIIGDAQSDQSVASKWHKADITSADTVISQAQAAGVQQLVCVGTTTKDSELAIEFAGGQPNCYASIGVHPHEAKDFTEDSAQVAAFLQLAQRPKVIAVGECGLDYFYNHSPKSNQVKALEIQLQLAQDHNLPVIFHVREAFNDFWPIFDNFQNIRGVIHSFTADQDVLAEVINRNLYVGLNGIITFTKESFQLEMAKKVPLQSLLLETDAPFLTPKPFRGKVCTPKHIVETAKFLSNLRGETLQSIARATTLNAKTLFSI